MTSVQHDSSMHAATQEGLDKAKNTNMSPEQLADNLALYDWETKQLKCKLQTAQKQVAQKPTAHALQYTTLKTTC